MHAGAVAGDVDAGAAAGRAARKVGRPQEALLRGGEGQRLALVPDVIAGGHDVGAGLERVVEDILGDAEAAGGVLAVDDDEIEPEVRDQAGQPVPDRGAAGTAHHVAEEEKSHDAASNAGGRSCASRFRSAPRRGARRAVRRGRLDLLAVEGDADQQRAPVRVRAAWRWPGRSSPPP